MSPLINRRTPDLGSPTNTSLRLTSPQEWLKQVCTGKEYAALSPKKEGADEDDGGLITSEVRDQAPSTPSRTKPDTVKPLLPPEYHASSAASSTACPPLSKTKSPHHLASRSTLIRAVSPDTFSLISSPVTNPTSSLATAWDLAAEQMMVYFDGTNDPVDGAMDDDDAIERTGESPLRGRLRGIGELVDGAPSLDDGTEEDKTKKKGRPSNAELKRREDERQMKIDPNRAREGYLAWERQEDEEDDTRERVIVATGEGLDFDGLAMAGGSDAGRMENDVQGRVPSWRSGVVSGASDGPHRDSPRSENHRQSSSPYVPRTRHAIAQQRLRQRQSSDSLRLSNHDRDFGRISSSRRDGSSQAQAVQRRRSFSEEDGTGSEGVLRIRGGRRVEMEVSGNVFGMGSVRGIDRGTWMLRAPRAPRMETRKDGQGFSRREERDIRRRDTGANVHQQSHWEIYPSYGGVDHELESQAGGGEGGSSVLYECGMYVGAGMLGMLVLWMLVYVTGPSQ